MPVSLALIQRINEVTCLDCVDLSNQQSLISLIVQQATDGQFEYNSNRGLFVVRILRCLLLFASLFASFSFLFWAFSFLVLFWHFTSLFFLSLDFFFFHSFFLSSLSFFFLFSTFSFLFSALSLSLSLSSFLSFCSSLLWCYFFSICLLSSFFLHISLLSSSSSHYFFLIFPAVEIVSFGKIPKMLGAEWLQIYCLGHYAKKFKEILCVG